MNRQVICAAEQPRAWVLEADGTTQTLALPFASVLGESHRLSGLPFLHLPERVSDSGCVTGGLWTAGRLDSR